ncbi:MAG: FG-GAP repeat domain-containing protein [Bosea sp. (in: a-proteobacteria)]
MSGSRPISSGSETYNSAVGEYLSSRPAPGDPWGNNQTVTSAAAETSDGSADTRIAPQNQINSSVVDGSVRDLERSQRQSALYSYVGQVRSMGYTPVDNANANTGNRVTDGLYGLDANGNGVIFWQGSGPQFNRTGVGNGTTVTWVVRDFQLVKVTETPNVGDNSGWKAMQTGDFNGDGKLDVLWKNDNTGQVVRWSIDPNTGALASSALLSINLGVNSGWSVVDGGDFNADGKDDVLWQNSSTGQTVVWTFNDDGSYKTGVVATPETPINDTLYNMRDNEFASVVADRNGDGRDDIVIRNINDSTLTYWNSVDTGVGNAPKFVKAEVKIDMG